MKMKPKPKKSTKHSLSEKIADALTLKPRADIEDDQVFGTKPHTVSRADFGTSESEDEALISDFRKRNVNLLSTVSKKYEGNVISRRELKQSFESDSSLNEDSLPSPQRNGKQKLSFVSNPETQNEILEEKSESESNFDSDIESDDYSITKSQKKTVTNSDDENSEDDEQESDDDEQGTDEGEGYDISQLEKPLTENFEHVKKQNISEDAKKGISVRNQLLVWEGLLEMRIHLQRCMNTANQMPMPNTYEELKIENDFSEESIATKTNLTNVLDKLLTLQNLLLKNYPETNTLSTKKKDKLEETTDVKTASDEEIPSDTDNEEIPSDTEEDEPVQKVKVLSNNKTIHTTAKKRKQEDYEKEIAISHKAFKSFRDTSIQKWNEKTRLSTASNIKTAPTNTILQQISYILSDREKLVKRTQLKRSEYDIVGYKKEIEHQSSDENPGMKDRKDNDEYISEIFDDSDFYHQLLRELIECKSADISDPVQLSRQWISLQQMRSKMKRKVDTKATKGRKIKYVVHNQLVNYMAPEKCITWTEESTNELYSSLFGKMFEHNNAGLNADVGNVFKLKN